MANKKEFVEYYTKYGKTHSWDKLAEIYDFSCGEALRSFVRRRLRGVTVRPGIETNEKIEIIFPTRNFIKNEPVLTEQNTNRENGEEVLTYQSDKALSPQEIDVLAGVDNVTRVVSRTWLKSNKNGVWTYSICTKLIDKSIQENIDYKSEFEKYLEEFNINKKVEKLKVKKTEDDSTNALIISLSDLHIDKLAANDHKHNLEHSTHIALSAAIDLIDRSVASHNIDKIYVIGGNDFFHCNSAANTTQKGTPLDVNSRWDTSFKKGLDLITDIISYAKQFALVEYITVLGNHSPEREWYLSVTLDALYKQDEKVIIETVNNTRKYFRYGTSAFMLSHEFGNKEKDLPVIFAIENAKDFAECKYKYVLSGHIHSKKETMFVGMHEQYGILHKVMPSMSTTDKWHDANLYIGNQKSCIALVINSKYGEIAELIYNV